jgi:3-oxoacyl-[acyl-carrier-protein] synthase-3
VDVHIAAIEYVLPDHSLTLEELAEQGRLTSRVEALRSFGFDRAWVVEDEGEQLALRAAQRLLARSGIDPASIGVVLYAGARPESHGGGDVLLAGFSYPAARLQYECGLLNARTIGVSQTGCLGMMTAVSLGRSLLAAEAALERVLCLSVDVLPAGSSREILYNLISDGACALLLQRGRGPNRLAGDRQVTKGYYWDCEARGTEIVAAYFPTARTVIRETLDSAGLRAEDIALILPHNVSLRSWEILLQLTGLPHDRLYDRNIPAKAHVISGDNFINLKDAQDEGRLHPGDRLLLFNFGFGASWASLLIEH